jgi:hypothetical protein
MATSFRLENSVFIASSRRDQRNPAHFPIERELRFRITGKLDEMAGSGMTIDIGSKRVVFRTDQTLLPGKRLDMAISWPVQLDQRCDLKLLASGRIVGADSGVVAVSIERYEFRTRGISGLAL